MMMVDSCNGNVNSNTGRINRHQLRETYSVYDDTPSCCIDSKLIIMEDVHISDNNEGDDDYDEIQVLARVNHCKTHVLNFRKTATSSSNSNRVVILSRIPTLEDIRKALCRVLGLTYDHSNNNSSNVSTNNTSLHFLSTQQSRNGDAVVRKEEKVWWLSCVTRVPAVGGKGGFGTLLKGQSKQAGAKRTIDFGACRDLNGRRLRHVNDEIKLQKWRQQQENDSTPTITQSGIENWHLPIPHWSDQHALSSKAKRRIDLKQQRKIQQKELKEQQKQQAKLQKQQQYQNAIQQYVNQTTTTMTMKDSVQRGILASLQNINNTNGKRKRPQANTQVNTINNDNNIDDVMESQKQLNWCTLSGDVLIHEFINDVGTVRFHNSMSEFATVALPSVATHISPNKINNLYYEVTIQTGGLAQIGWASSLTHFQPYDVDGVGDDDYSFGYDGYRCAKFHSTPTTVSNNDVTSINSSYGQHWQSNDVISCFIYSKMTDANDSSMTNIVVEYFHNGKSLGDAFTLPSTEFKNCSQNDKNNITHDKDQDLSCQGDNYYYPALSLNEGEIIDVNVGPNFKFKDCIATHGTIISLSDLFQIMNNKGAATPVSEQEEDLDDAKKTTNKRLKTTDSNNNCFEESVEGDINKELAIDKKPPAKIMNHSEDSKIDSSTFKIESTASNNIPFMEEEQKRDEAVRVLTMDDLNSYSSIQELEELGLDNLKRTLMVMGLKCGGTLHDRAARLYSIKGINDRHLIPKKVRGKNFSLFKQ